MRQIDIDIFNQPYATLFSWQVRWPQGMARISSAPSHLSKFFKGLQRKAYLCDVAFVVGEENAEVYGIKAILCARSRVFGNLFYLQAIQSNRKKVKNATAKQDNLMQLIKVPVYTKSEFSMLMEYVHCGVCDIGPKNAISLFVAADEFELINLKRCCVSFLGQHLSLDNVTYVLAQLERFQSRACAIELEPLVYNFIRMNAAKVLSGATVVVLSKTQLIRVFCLEGLKLLELDKFNAALIWSKAQFRKNRNGHSSLQYTFAPFLNCIKLTKIPIQSLVDEVRRSKVVPERLLAHACAYNELKESFHSKHIQKSNSDSLIANGGASQQPTVVGMQPFASNRAQKIQGKSSSRKLIKMGKNRYDVAHQSLDDLDSEINKPRLTKTRRTLSTANIPKPVTKSVPSASRSEEPSFSSFNPKVIRTSRSSKLLISSSTEVNDSTPSRPRLTKSSKVSTPLLDIMF